MKPRRIPRQSGLTPRPFSGGANPFSDDSPAPLPAAPLAHPMASPQAEVQPFRAAEYEVTQPSRAPRVLFCGLAGAFLITASLVIVILAGLRTSLLSLEILWMCPTAMVGVSISLNAWVSGRNDLAAMRFGAMDAHDRRYVQIGYWCGAVGTVVGSLLLAVAVVAVAMA